MKTIITPVLRFWGFKRHPFDDGELSREDDALFVDRTTEVRQLHNALSNPLSAVFGAQGVGKSSVLNKLATLVRNDGYPVAMVQMSGISESLLYRNILKSVLKEIEAGNVKVKASLKLKAGQELELLENSIKYTSAVEASGEVGWKAALTLALKTGIKEQEEHSLTQHTEDSALSILQNIALHKKEPFVVMVNNLERAKFMLNDDDAYFKFITCFSQTIDGAFSGGDVPFVVTLDQSFADRIDGYLPGAEEALSFSFGRLIGIADFNPRDLYEIIVRRLECRNWPGTVDDFIARGAFWALMGATGGHPRRAFAVLREAMELIAEQGAEKTICMAHILEAIRQCGEVLNQKDVFIVQFLEENGAHSSSDPKFAGNVGLSRAQLHKRLQELQKKGFVGVKEEAIEKTKRDLYFIEELKL